MLLRQPRGEDPHLRLRLFQGDAGFETRHGEIIVAGPRLEILRVDRQRRPDLNISRGILEFGAHDPDDGMEEILQADRLPDDVRVFRVTPLPETVPENDKTI